MKTTLDLDDAPALRGQVRGAQTPHHPEGHRGTRLAPRAAPPAEISNPDPEKLEAGPLGFLVLKRKPGESITLEQVQAIQKELDEEEFLRAIHPRQA